MSTFVTAAELARDAVEFVRFKRAMGHPYQRGEIDLPSFIRFVTQQWGEHGKVPLDEAISRWCGRIPGRKAVTLGNEFGVVRQMCLYRRRRDPTTYVPEHALAPVKESRFAPYIFNRDEVRRILTATASYPGHVISPSMLRVFILVLYCTGLRLGEAVRLRLTDADLDLGTLLIQASKGRSRIVPIRPDLIAELRTYLAERLNIVRARPDLEPERFFLRLDGAPLTVGSISAVICRLLRGIGIKPQSGRIGPRPYEFRHVQRDNQDENARQSRWQSKRQSRSNIVLASDNLAGQNSNHRVNQLSS